MREDHLNDWEYIWKQGVLINTVLAAMHCQYLKEHCQLWSIMYFRGYHTLSVKGQMLNILVFAGRMVSTLSFTILYKGKTILSFWTKLIWPVGHSYPWCKWQGLCWIMLISLCEPVLVLGTEELMIIYDHIQVTWIKMCEYAFKLWHCLKT